MVAITNTHIQFTVACILVSARYRHLVILIDLKYNDGVLMPSPQ